MERLLKESEYAQLRNCSVAAIRKDRWLRRGCPWLKIGASVRYAPADVQEYLNARRQEIQQPGGGR